MVFQNLKKFHKIKSYSHLLNCFIFLNFFFQGFFLSFSSSATNKCLIFSSSNQDLHFKSISETSLLAKDLKPFTEYSIVVQAVNRHGEGPLSEEVFVSTLEDGKKNYIKF